MSQILRNSGHRIVNLFEQAVLILYFSISHRVFSNQFNRSAGNLRKDFLVPQPLPDSSHKIYDNKLSQQTRTNQSN